MLTLVLSCLFLLALLESAESDGITECLLNSTSAEGNTCQVTSCTAITLVCGISCNSQGFAEIRWNKGKRHGDKFYYWPLPDYYNRTTIELRADDVTQGTSGYYKCYCYCRGPQCRRLSRSLSSSAAFIRLQVHPLPGKPQSALKKTCNSYELHVLQANLTESDVGPGPICIDAGTTSNSSPVTYTWYKRNAQGDMQPIDTFNEGQCNPTTSAGSPDLSRSRLCILPALRGEEHRPRKQYYMAKVSNEFGNISVHAEINLPVTSHCGPSSWFLRPHEKQSTGTVTINANGTATVYCAAYEDDPQFEMRYRFCRGLDSDNSEVASCYLEQSSKNCIECGDHGRMGQGQMHFISSYTNISDELGSRTRVCMINILNYDHQDRSTFSCIARRHRVHRTQNTYMGESALQGTPEELLGVQEIGTFVLTNPVGLTTCDPTTDPGCGDSQQVPDAVIVGLAVSLGCMIAVGVVVMVAICVCIFKFRTKKQLRPDTARCRQAGLEQGVQRQNSNHCQSEIHSNLVACQNPDRKRSQVSSGDEQLFRERSSSYQKCKALRVRLQSEQDRFIPGIKVHDRMLAVMKEREIIGPGDFEELKYRLDRRELPSDIGSHFFKDILLNWAPKVFTHLLQTFTDILEEDEDPSNKGCARTFRHDIFELELSQSNSEQFFDTHS